MITSVQEAFRHLEICGPVSSPRALKRAYRKAVLKWHPDRFTDPTARMDAEAATYGILAAYEFLKGVPENDERVYARPTPGWWRRPASVAGKPARQQWLPPSSPSESTWRHSDRDERCGRLQAFCYSGLIAAVVMIAFVIVLGQLDPNGQGSRVAPMVPPTPGQAATARKAPAVRQALPPLKLAPSLLQDSRESTRRYQEIRAKRRVFGESAAAYNQRRGAGISGPRDEQELQRWSTDYARRMRSLTAE